jgi:DNA-binding CsgD family transcriptional regulator
VRRSDHHPGQSFSPLFNPVVRRLTDREREVALLIADGLKNASIAARLGLAPATVGSYVQRIRQRLDVDTRDEIAAWVRERIDPDDPETGVRRA